MKWQVYFHFEGGEVDFSPSPISTNTNVAFSITLIIWDSRRKGVNLTVLDAKAMVAVIGPLLKQGQLPYQIVTSHPNGAFQKTKWYRKRIDRKCLPGRTYKEYIFEDPDVFVTQMDTVHNGETNGRFDLIESILGQDLFRKYVHVLLTNRGSEFSFAEAMETSPGR